MSVANLGRMPETKGNQRDYIAESYGGEKNIVGKPLTAPNLVCPPQPRAYDFALAIYVHSGAISVATETQARVISPGLLAFVPPRSGHTTVPKTELVSAWFVCIPAPFARLLHSDIRIFHGSDLLRAAGRRIVSLGACSVGVAKQRRIALCFIDELLSAKEASSVDIPLPKDRKLREITAKIIANPEDQNGIDLWAGEAGMSRRSFTRMFSQETGFSFVEWRLQVKMNFALRWLRDGKTLSDVASSLGYRSSSAFIAAFRRHFGSTPREYLDRHA